MSTAARVHPQNHSGLTVPLGRLLGVLALLAITLALAPATLAQTLLNRPRNVAVLDFTVPRTTNDTILSRQTTDAFAEELQRTGTFEVTPRNQVERAISDLELTSPLTRSNLIRLGQSLGTDYIAIGRLENLTRLHKPERVHTTLRVLFFDVSTGQYANGARVTGLAMTPAGGVSAEENDHESLAAISDAAFNAVRTIANYQQPEATVLISRNDTVWLNGGVRNGIHAGQEFIILRNGQQVGRVRVTDVNSQDAQAHIIDEGRGIRPEDKARLVIDPNDLPGMP